MSCRFNKFLVIVFIIILTGCGGADTGNAGTPVVITLSKPKECTEAFLEIIKRFEEQNPLITVNMIEMPLNSTERRNVYLTELSGGSDSVDVYWLDDVWLKQFSALGYLEELENPDNSKYIDSVLDYGTYNGKLYALPAAMDSSLIFYRRDLINSPVNTWGDIKKISNELLQNNAVDYGFAYLYDDGDEMICNAAEYVWGSGGSLFDPESNMADGLKNYKDIASKLPYNRNGSAVSSLFKNGKIAFMQSFGINKKYLDDEADIKGKIGVTNILSTDGDRIQTLYKVYALAVNKYSLEKDAAEKLIEFWSGDAVQQLQAERTGLMPVITEVFERERVLEDNPYFKDVPKKLDRMAKRPSLTNYSEISYKIEQILGRFLKDEIDENIAEREIKDILEVSYAEN
jgi:multiple sugar transport system substrate-binding protein